MHRVLKGSADRVAKVAKTMPNEIRGDVWDCAVIGGGPAGLTAATYLGRFIRKICLIDDRQSRVKRIPLARNVPGFPEGVRGPQLLDRLRRQAEQYGAHLFDDRVSHLEKRGQLFQLSVAGKALTARSVLLATGAHLHEPNIPGLNEGIARGLVRYCPICDGYEVQGQRVAVLGGRAGALNEARFLRGYTEQITFLWLAGFEPDADECARAQRAGIMLGPEAVRAIELGDGVHATFQNAGPLAFDTIYPSLGCLPQTTLAVALGARLAADGGVEVDAHGRTSVAGLYAAGDVLSGLDQIARACGDAAIAATAIHNDLRERDDG